MYVLRLRDMRSEVIGELSEVARAETVKELEDFIVREKVGRYQEEHEIGDAIGIMFKTFRKDGPLEWYNPPIGVDKHIIDVRTADQWAKDWADNARLQFKQQVMSLPLVGG